MDRGSGRTGSEGAVLRFLVHKRDVLHGAFQGHQFCRCGGMPPLSGQRDWGGTASPGPGLAAATTRVHQKGSQQGRLPDGTPKATPGPNALQQPPSPHILKMGDFKKGPWCEIWDGLYWRFIDSHLDDFQANPRLSMMVRLLERREPGRLT